jgi:hypothetical protein
MFSVRSAYNLALTERSREEASSSSSSPDGVRKLWSNLWSCDAPPKVKIFGWKLNNDILPTKGNKFKRKLEPTPTCDLCGNGYETSYDAVVVCPQARALRQAMSQHWNLPDEFFFSYTGKDWLLLLLDRVSKDLRGLILLVLWRAWQVFYFFIFWHREWGLILNYDTVHP